MRSREQEISCNSVGLVSFFFGIIGGTLTSIVMKLIYQQESRDIRFELKPFEKPMFLTFVMFLAMAFALPIFALKYYMQAPIERVSIPHGVLLSLIVPSIFDLLGTNFAQIGLVYTTASYFQLLRCTVIIVTALLKSVVLKHNLSSYMWVGIGINTGAMCLVGSTNFFESAEMLSGSSSNPTLGVFFILLSCIVQGSQYIFEEKVMSSNEAHPLLVIGMEGFWGSLIMFALFPVLYYIPGRDSGSVENIWDTLTMLRDNETIQFLLTVFFITVTLYNVSCIYLTAYLSAVWHAILDNFRPVSVWLLDLSIYYCLSGRKFGEPWTKYSWLQLVGMLTLFAGTAVYNGSIKVPWLDYTKPEYEAISRSPGMAVPIEFASSVLFRSPVLHHSSINFSSPGTTESRSRGRLALLERIRQVRIRSSSEDRLLLADGKHLSSSV